MTTILPADAPDRARLVDQLWGEIRSRWGTYNLARVRDSLDIWSYRKTAKPYANQEAKGFYVPGLPDEPWLDPEILPFTQLVREAFPEMKREAARFVDGRMSAPPFGLPDDAPADAPPNPGFPAGWLEWRFAARGALIPDRCKDFPASAEVARQILEKWTIKNITLLMLLPGARRDVHCDFNNSFVNLQMGLIVPEGCGLTVAGETRVHRPGHCFLFNHAYAHDAYNNSPHMRIVFSVSALHPRLADHEREIARFLLPHIERHIASVAI
ncbi:aspartyl/asparaginyl beta-hydroxylase domain-containing protein [Sinorhizobium meliloti]|uniref:aspartyl/asparaginyl beta-hydroxylase domain-containing protein n=1 Tax=Rhizobium meliloti TaxID=382 RepID=UPI000FD8B247|nr:aspartyl/asparaginyl beta-hydroxylase domain-containing protein [Sinorhizobium meliloti]RVQ56045.1 aspartyl/asparaginyl beta-hydroxylase domain-containing protein [Sinorhizobium meliloti]